MRVLRCRLGAAVRVLAPILALVAPAAAQDVSTQFWPEIDTFVRLNENMRIYVPAAKTKEGSDDSDLDGTAGVYFDYYAAPFMKLWYLQPADNSRTRRLLLRAGYSYTAGGDGQPGTNTLEAEGTWRVLLPWEVLASERNRFDLNFTGGEFDPRYRNRLRLERSVALGKPTLTPYLYGEFFYSFNDGDWSKIRVAAGLEFHMWERFVPEVYFQRDFNNGSSGDVNGFGLVLSIYLR